MNSKGVLYISTGTKYVKAAIRSAQTVNKHCPNLSIHLFTDSSSYDSFGFSMDTKPFTSIGIITDPHPRSKVEYMANTPFDNTLYLDSDTAFHEDIQEMFQLMDRFDIAMAHAQHRGARNTLPWRIALPQAYPEFNSGVVLYKSTPQMVEFLKDWGFHFLTDWEEAGIRNDQPKHDQTPLRELLWLSDLRIATLPPEYNVRFLKYPILWSKSEATAKIYHLKQFHFGWLPWIYKSSRLKWLMRKINPLKITNRIKKTLGRNR